MPTQPDQQPHDAFADQVEDLLRRLGDAQVRADVDELTSLLSDDFKLVGPLGFVVAKPQWLAQFHPGALEVSAIAWDELDLRTYADAQVSIAIGRLQQRAQYAGRSSDGTFRVTAVAVRAGNRWLVAGLHYSPIAPPPGSGPAA
jgi:ketosteroid isomerase-like protein